MFRQATPFRFLVALVFRASAQEMSQSGLRFSGYYKSLLEGSGIIVPGGRRHLFDLNRLRLQLQGRLSEYVAVGLQYDNELLFGSYLHIAQFASQSSLTPGQYSDLDGNYSRGDLYYDQHRLYRGNITLSSGDTGVHIGRQRIAWGTGRFWSPLNLLNPLDPTAIEREEHMSVDAMLAEYKLGPISRISAVYAPGHGGADSSAALNWHANMHGVDYSVVGGCLGNEQAASFDLTGQTGTAGIRGELMQVRAKTGSTYQYVALTFDYTFVNTFTLSAEPYYNGAGTTNAAAYDFTSLLAGKIRSVAKYYAGDYMGYEIMPLLKRENYVVVNLDDHSRFVSPLLTYSIRTNLDWQIGAQFSMDSSDGEFGHFHHTYYTQIQWFF